MVPRAAVVVLVVWLTVVSVLAPAAAQQKQQQTAPPSPAASPAAAGRGGRGAPPPAPEAGGDGIPPMPSCPGVVGGVCTIPCQRVLCESLGVFFNASYNASNPWNDTTGWELTQTLGCARLVTPAAAARPAYCQWPGIACCGPADAAAGRCKVVHAIANLSLAVNQVNCSMSDPRFLGVLDQLHACGMVVLNLEANEIGGALPQGRLGRLTNLVILDLANNWINGTIPDDLANLTRLRRLGLGTNFLSGTIGDWVGGLVGLEVLELGANSGVNPPDPVTGEELAGIVGTVPQGVAQLTKLVELNLQTNALSGTIPRQLCGPTTRLRVLNMRSNRLTGSPAGVVNCTKLTQLDLSMNQFTGSAPATQGWEQLVQLALGNNNFEGTIPVDIYFAPTLAYLDISDNRLTGTINININLMTYLTELDLSHNQLSGELGPDIFYLPQLSRLNLAGNNFEGTISESIGLAYSLTELMLSNNTGLIGPMPNDAAFLRYLQRLSATKTNMSCVPAKEVVAAKRAREAVLNASLAGATAAAAAGGWWPKCNPEKRLPCFLEFAEYDIPRSDSSNMRCFPVRRKPQAEAQVDCRTGSAFGLLDDAVQAEQQQWDLSPSYYQYANCRCLSGFREVWTRNGTHLACEANPKSQPLPPWAWVFVALGAVLAVLAAAILSLGSRLVLFRTRWAREMELKRKRARGSPKGGGTISVVVTDIEGYSELMKTSPSLTTKALNLHNAVLKKAAHFHAGHVFEQEGDSWAVAFHDAQDAVAFCMQAQQALHKVDWPAGLMEGGIEDHQHFASLEGTVMTENSSPGSSLTGRNGSAVRGGGGGGSGASSSVAQGLRSLITARSSALGGRQSGGGGGGGDADGDAGAGDGPPAWEQSMQLAQLTAAQVHANLSFTTHVSHESRTSSASLVDGLALDGIDGANPPTSPSSPAAAAPGFAAAPASLAASGRAASAGDALPAGPPGDQPPRDAAGAGMSRGGSVRSASSLGTDAAGGALPPHLSVAPRSQTLAPGSSLGSRRTSRRGTSQSRFFNMLLGPAQGSAAAALDARLFFGLRVRMGVASGVLPAGAEIRNSSVFDLAKVVSDMGNGGQVLMDAHTFDQVKDRVQELGAVDHYGYNDRLLIRRDQGVKGLRSAACGAFGCCAKQADEDGAFGCCARRADEDGAFGAAQGGQMGGTDLLIMDMGEFETPGINVTAALDADPAPTSATSVAGVSAGKPQAASAAAATPAGGEPQPRTPKDDAAARTPKGADGRGGRGGDDLSKPSLSAPSFTGRAAAEAALRLLQPSQSSLTGRGGGRPGRGAAARPARQLLRVYSVLPAGLAQRAKAWGSQLNVKDGWRQTDRGFFDAPGAEFAEGLGTSLPAIGGLEPERDVPPVTMVFAAVEGAKSLLRWRRAAEAAAVAPLLRRVMAAALDAVPGGYLCREQEGELKYMLAFPSAAAALQWCLLVQEAAMYAPWPASVLETPEFAEVHAPGDGALLFRGPRLKMGVCEGVPRSILCDHVGRVDYHGASVNQAARYMDAAAHGGQVATEATLAEGVFRDWRAGDSNDARPYGPGDSGRPEHARDAAAVARLLRATPPLSLGASVANSSGSSAGPGPPTSAAGALGLGAGAGAPGLELGARNSGGGGDADGDTDGRQVLGLVTRYASMTAMLSRPSVRWSEDEAGGRGARSAGGVAAGAAGGAGGGGGGADEDDVAARVAARTFSGTQLTRARPGPDGLVRPAPILKHSAIRGGVVGGGGPLVGGGARAPLGRLRSGSLYPEEQPWPVGSRPASQSSAAPPDLSSLRQPSLRAAPRQLSWTGAAAAGVGGGGGGGLDSHGLPPRPGPAQQKPAAQDPSPAPLRVVNLRCLHLGTFRFKGSDPVDIVWVTAAALAARAALLPREEPKGKGRRIEERAGVADAAITSLADILPGLREMYLEEAGAADAGRGADAAAGGAADGESAAAYASWLSRELGRRRRFGGTNGGPLVYQRPPGAPAGGGGPGGGGGLGAPGR